MRREYQHHVEGASAPINVIYQDHQENFRVVRRYSVSGPVDALIQLSGIKKDSDSKMFSLEITTENDSDELPIQTIVALCSLRWSNMKMGSVDWHINYLKN